MDESITYLNIPKRLLSHDTTTIPSLFIGRKYHLPTKLQPANLHGICADFACSPDRGGAIAFTDNKTHKNVFLWDSDSLSSLTGTTLVTTAGESIDVTANTPILNNRFVVGNTCLSKPAIQTLDNEQQLTMQVEYDFLYTADQIDARIGALNLVESNCFLLLENGQQHNLLNTNEQAVLFLTDGNRSNAISPVIDITKSDAPVKHNWQINIAHPIPEQVNGIAMQSLTILEQYQTFFLQRELPFSAENIWTPVCNPISWGWSMRVARRYDGEWGIARQKLLMPCAGHDGMEMPAWKNNSLIA